ncbi:MAG: wax ester/triacylglycerol synthase family O-acyltransferase [Ilumatobacteraceae bacterium]
MNRMGPLDALFLDTEDGTTHMHIGSCAVFAGPPPTMTELARLIDSKLHLVPRFRQIVRFVPGGIGRPVWVDDTRFDLAFHLRHAAVAPPGRHHDIDGLMGQLMSHELDRGHPLWGLWLVEGLEGGRWALISKVHHCMVDGVSGTDLMAVLLDRTARAAVLAPQPWLPAAAPSDALLVLDAFGELARTPARQLKALLQAARAPGRTMRRLNDVQQGLRSFARRAGSRTPQLSIDGSIGRQRRWSAGRCSLADARVIKSVFGGSINDVVLAAITGAFRDLLIQRGDAVDVATLTSLVPVSIREEDDHTPSNQVSLMIVELPVGIADPLERLAAVHTRMTELKASHQAQAGAAVVEAANFLPPMALALAARAAMTLLRRTPQHVITTVTTNVPGPSFPLFACGREMLEYLPFVPVSEGVRVGVAILSYNGTICFGITGDDDSAPDVESMAIGIETAMAVLHDLAAATTASAGC